jgi:hypothetical protein
MLCVHVYTLCTCIYSVCERNTLCFSGTAGHDVEPVSVAGCYAPGGRYPLPSSVLMTAVTARAAGVPQVMPHAALYIWLCTLDNVL